VRAPTSFRCFILQAWIPCALRMHISFELPESILYCVLSSCVTVVPNDLQTCVFTASCLSSQNNSDAIVCLFWFALFKHCALVESSCKRSSPGATHVARTHQIASNKVERKNTLEIAQLIHRIPSSARMSPANRLSPLFRHNEASQFRDGQIQTGTGAWPCGPTAAFPPSKHFANPPQAQSSGQPATGGARFARATACLFPAGIPAQCSSA
jgi:hypothetical protein